MWRDYQEQDWDNWSYDEDWTTDWTTQNEDKIITKDSNWNILADWDNVVAIKDIKVKGSKDIKRWDKFRNIRLTGDSGLIESGKMVLKTEFFKKI